jgi:mRNA interferase RelE/StbE
MGMKFLFKYTALSKKDYDRLDESQKIQIRKSLSKIKMHGMEAGRPLRGKLHDCRKLKHKKLGLRVIFRQSDEGIEIIEIVVVGNRSDGEVYNIAEERLGRK